MSFYVVITNHCIHPQKWNFFFFHNERCEKKLEILRSKPTTKEEILSYLLRYKSFHNVVQRIMNRRSSDLYFFFLEICATFFQEYYVSLLIKQALS